MYLFKIATINHSELKMSFHEFATSAERSKVCQNLGSTNAIHSLQYVFGYHKKSNFESIASVVVR